MAGHSHDHSHLSDAHSHSHEHAHPAAPHEPDSASSIEPDSASSIDREEAHKATVQATFDLYRQHSLSANQRRRADYFSLSSQHRALLPGYSDLLKQVDQKLLINSELVAEMAMLNIFPPSEDAALSAPAPSEEQHERLRSTLRQCARDWSSNGKAERDATYTPIIEALQRNLASYTAEERASLKVLVPGAGLARLAWEIVRAGFSCQANEFSYYMIIASSFILNNTSTPNEWELYPYLHTFSNIRSSQDLLQPIHLPDVDPTDIGGNGADFSFAAGDFLELYRTDKESWDAVATCFFLDTARNVVDYLETIYSILTPGGTWVNCGPTLWHFENSSDGSSSIELTLEDVKSLAKRIGFIFEEERETRTSYCSNPLSLFRQEYTASFWVAKKPS